MPPVASEGQRPFVAVAGSDPVMQGLVAGVVIAFLDLVGGLLIFVWRDPSQRSMDAALGGAAGVMLAAGFTSLVIPGIEAEPNGGIVPVVVGLVLGVAVLDRADAWVPHVHVLNTGRVREDGASGASAASGGPDETRVASVLLHSRDALVDLCGGEPPSRTTSAATRMVPDPT